MQLTKAARLPTAISYVVIKPVGAEATAQTAGILSDHE